MKTIVILMVLVAVTAAIGYSQRAPIAEQLMAAALPARMGTDQVAALEDGLHVALCGAGGPMPAPKASGPCVVVVAGDQLFLVDSGTNGPRNLQVLGYPAGRVNGVFLSHFHSDHIDGLGELATFRWATGDDVTPLPVYGPDGVEQVVAGFNAVMHRLCLPQCSSRRFCGTAACRPQSPLRRHPGELTLVFEGDGLAGRARVDHKPVYLPWAIYSATRAGID